MKFFSFNFAPKNWAMCNGQLLSINQNQALFAILGTTFGGNGVQTFALPDMRGRVPVHWGNGYTLGSPTGTETVTLNSSQLPSHTHSFNGVNSAGLRLQPNNFMLANVGNAYNHYAPATAQTLQPLNPASISTVGGQPHTNIQPYLVMTAAIALAGIFPTRN
jgi:microcystin-dependent protein